MRPVHFQDAGCFFDEFIALFRDVLRLEPHGMGRTVGHLRGHDVGERSDASCLGRLGLLQNEAHGAAGQDHAVASLAERDGRTVEFFFSGGCSDR